MKLVAIRMATNMTLIVSVQVSIHSYKMYMFCLSISFSETLILATIVNIFTQFHIIVHIYIDCVLFNNKNQFARKEFYVTHHFDEKGTNIP
jgi:hypothetical protein